MRDGWLLKGDQVVCSVEVAETRRERRRGLLGRDGIDGAMAFPATRGVHSRGMRFAIDVAYLDRGGTVIDVVTMAPGGRGRRVRRCRTVVEAEAGAFARWGVAVGDVLEVRA